VHHEDLEPYGLATSPFDPQRAVGWLQRGHAYPTGQTAPEVISRLFAFVTDPWIAVTRNLGYDPCNLCIDPPAKAPTVVTWRPATWGRRRQAEVGAAILYVPGTDRVYVAPSMILHYIVVHRYAPPAVFTEAVLACPVPGSVAHRASMTALGLDAVFGH
jgi:hypothetical protein